jgi:hypothetical protein
MPLADELGLIEDRAAGQPGSGIDSAELYAVISALPDDFRDAHVAIDGGTVLPRAGEGRFGCVGRQSRPGFTERASKWGSR